MAGKLLLFLGRGLHVLTRRKVLETLLKGWKREGGNKVLIFTKSVKLLEMLEFHLNSRSL